MRALVSLRRHGRRDIGLLTGSWAGDVVLVKDSLLIGDDSAGGHDDDDDDGW